MSKIFVTIKNDSFKSAHVVVFKDGKVLILRRSSTDQWMPNHYGLPGGKIEKEETIYQAACRECKEEINIDVYPEDLIFLSKANNKEHAFLYTTKFTGDLKLDFEHDDFQWVNPKNLSNYKVVPDLIEMVSYALEDLM